MLFAGKRFHLELGSKTYVMGILNVTPDSFSDGGRYFSADAALAHAEALVRAGADILDVGAESTKPGHVPVPPEEEIARLRPMLGKLCDTVPIPVSVDTRHPETAAWALSQGASIINDVSGVFSPQMAKAVQESGAGWIITHGADADQAGTGNPLPQIRRFFSDMLEKAHAAGIEKTQLCFDPGIGFGKSREGDLAVLRALRQLSVGTAMLVGASRKRVIGTVSGEADPLRRLPGTIACHTAAIAGGADIIRVHDVAESVQAARMADAILRPAETAQEGKILLHDLRIFARHGVNPEEAQFGQSFLVDAQMTVDFSAAVAGDALSETVSYAKAAKTIREALTAERYDLIETAADSVVRALFCAYPTIRRIRLRLKKPDAPMKAECAWAAVELERER